MTAPGKAPGTLFVVSAPSGAGKTSLVRALIARDRDVVLSVSHTTRAARPEEHDGDHYHFVDESTFGRLRDEGEFLEHAQVFGNAYGTSRTRVEERLARGLDVVLEIDWQGARQVHEHRPDCVRVFVLPPSLAQLEARLRSRGQDDPQVIARRMRAAVREIEHYAEYDFLVVNDRFETALEELAAIVRVQRLTRAAQSRRHAGLLRELLAAGRDA